MKLGGNSISIYNTTNILRTNYTYIKDGYDITEISYPHARACALLAVLTAWGVRNVTSCKNMWAVQCAGTIYYVLCNICTHLLYMEKNVYALSGIYF